MEISNEQVMLTYADDYIVIIVETKKEVIYDAT